MGGFEEYSDPEFWDNESGPESEPKTTLELAESES